MINLYTTLPVLGLCLIYKPFITKLDGLKYIFFGVVSVLTIIITLQNEKLFENFPWDDLHANLSLQALPNHISEMTQYLSHNTIQNTVLNNLLNLLMLSIVAVTINSLTTRWVLPITFVKPRSNRYVSIFMNKGMAIIFFSLGIISRDSYGANVTFVLSSIGLLFYTSGSYFVRRWRAITCSTLVVTLYSYCVNLNSFPERSVYYQAGLALVVSLTCNQVDHLDGILNMYPLLVTTKTSEIQTPYSLYYWYCMARLYYLLPTETELDAAPIENMETTIKFLGSNSRVWKIMSLLYPFHLRQDLCLLAAFFRTTDDLIDDAPTEEAKIHHLAIIRRFVKEAFIPCTDQKIQNVDWSYYEKHLPSKSHVAVFKSIARMTHFLSPESMTHIADAWELDIRNEPKKTEDDLASYAALISGSFFELCVYAIMYKTGNGNWATKKNVDKQIVFKSGTRLGECLQLVNIARDVIADSLDGLCYVPLEYMSHPKEMYRILKEEKKPSKIKEGTLKGMSLRILDRAGTLVHEVNEGIDALPSEARKCQRAAFEIYWAIGESLRKTEGFPMRAKVPTSVRLKIAFRCLYGFRGPKARQITSFLKN